MGFMDAHGYFKLTDRKKDMIIVSGFKVFPNEIEDVVMMHPGVLEVAAIGAPDDKSGEVVKIVVVRKDPAADEATAARALRQVSHRLQGSEDRRVSHRAAAEDQHRQDSAPAAARPAAGISKHRFATNEIQIGWQSCRCRTFFHMRSLERHRQTMSAVL